MSISCYCTPNSFDSRALVNPVCHGGNWQDHRSTLSYIMSSLINNKALGQKSLNQSFWGFYFGAASKSIVAEISEALMDVLNKEGTLKNLLILSQWIRTRDTKIARPFSEEQRKWGRAGGWRCPKTEVREQKVWREYWAQGQKATALASKLTVAIYKDLQKISGLGPCAQDSSPSEWRRLPTPQGHPLTLNRHPHVSQPPPRITICLYTESPCLTHVSGWIKCWLSQAALL